MLAVLLPPAAAGMTFAVNFWWSSQLSTLLQACPHQHHYLLRQLLTAVSGEAVQLLLAGIQPWQQHQQQQQEHGARVCGNTVRPVPAAGVPEGAAGAQPEAVEARRQRPHSQLGKRPAGGDSDAEAAAAEPDATAGTIPQPAAAGSKRVCGSSSDTAQPCGLTAFEQVALDALLSDTAAAEAPAAAAADDAQLHPQHEGGAPAQQGASHSEQQQDGQQPSGLLPDAAWWQQQAGAQEHLLAAAVARCSSSSQGGGGGWALGLHGTAARVLAALQPGQLLRVLWAGATHRPEQVARLLLHGLSPAAAQLLTRGFEAADGLFAGDGDVEGGSAAGAEARADAAPAGLTQAAFYSSLYSTVPDPAAVLQALLAGKVALWDAAARLVLGAHLGWASL
jgi:hypothetical protein